jgi:hypothetical protein
MNQDHRPGPDRILVAELTGTARHRQVDLQPEGLGSRFARPGPLLMARAIGLADDWGIPVTGDKVVIRLPVAPAESGPTLSSAMPRASPDDWPHHAEAFVVALQPSRTLSTTPSSGSDRSLGTGVRLDTGYGRKWVVSAGQQRSGQVGHKADARE